MKIMVLLYIQVWSVPYSSFWGRKQCCTRFLDFCPINFRHTDQYEVQTLNRYFMILGNLEKSRMDVKCQKRQKSSPKVDGLTAEYER